MKLKILALTLLSISITSMVFLQKDAEKTDNMLHYIHKEPEIKSDKPPLIILLHGVGSNEQDLFSFADQLPARFLVVSARGPYKLGQDSYGWYHIDYSTGKSVSNKEEAEKSRNTLITFIDELSTIHSFDKSQVYLCGFSQGAIMSYSVGLTHPEKVKGIALMSGRLLEEVKPLVAPKDKLQKLDIFISHGTKDPVLNIAYAREAHAYLQQLGLNPVYKEYPEPHTISRDMFVDLLKWLK
jgi:phospholipase/carboxylesterase